MSYEKRSYSCFERAQMFAAFKNVEIGQEESMDTSEVVETEPEYGKFNKFCIIKLKENLFIYFLYKIENYGYSPHPESCVEPGLLLLIAKEDFSRVTLETIIRHDACNAPIRVNGMGLLPKTVEPSNGPSSVVMEAMRSQYLGQAYTPLVHEQLGQVYGPYKRLYNANAIECYPNIATPGQFTVPNLLEFNDEVEGNKFLDLDERDEIVMSEDEDEEYSRDSYGGGAEE